MDLKQRITRAARLGYTLTGVLPPTAELAPNSQNLKAARGKGVGMPGPNGWHGVSGWTDQPLNESEVERLADAGGNAGLLCRDFRIADVDFEDGATSDLVETTLRATLGRRALTRCRDNSGSRAIIYRANGLGKKDVLTVLGPDGKKLGAVELLGDGQQGVIFGTHPSGAELLYRGQSPATIPPHKLDAISPEQIDVALRAVERTLAGALPVGCTFKRSGRTGAASEPIPQADLVAPTTEKLAHVVAKLPNDYGDRKDYVTFGCAVKAAAGQDLDEGYDIFCEWADRWTDGDNDPETVEKDWRGFKPPFRVGYPWLLDQLTKDELAAIVFEFEEGEPEPREESEPLAAIRKHNEQHAVVRVSGKTRVLIEEDDGSVSYATLADHRAFHKPDKIRVPLANGSTKVTELVPYWLGHDKARRHTSVRFLPGQSETGSVLNLWRGWKRTPSSDGSCDLFLWHIREVVCSGDTDHARWVLTWLADIFQNPQRKLGQALVLHGEPGTGKSIIGDILGEMLGNMRVVASQDSQVTGNFNAHLERCLLLQAEESFFAGSKRDAGALKHLVTGGTIRVEPKGIDSYEVPSYLRLMVTSNEEWVWPAAAGERRASIFRVSPKRRGDEAYFNALFRQLDDGGYENLLHRLLNAEIEDSFLRKLPATEAQKEQAVHTLAPAEGWLLQLLTDGVLPGGVLKDGSVLCPVSLLHERYKEDTRGTRYQKNLQSFGLFLKHHLGLWDLPKGTTDRTLVTIRGGRVRSLVKRIPPLAVCRKRWSDRGEANQQEWGKPDEWISESDLDEIRGEL